MSFIIHAIIFNCNINQHVSIPFLKQHKKRNFIAILIKHVVTKMRQQMCP